MSGHRHATDRQEVTALAQCPEADGENGHMVIELDGEGTEEATEEMLAVIRDDLGECHCGRELDFIAATEPTEVLE